MKIAGGARGDRQERQGSGDAADADTLWITAFFFNARKESGPAAQPISLNLPAARAVPAGASLKIAA